MIFVFSTILLLTSLSRPHHSLSHSCKPPLSPPAVSTSSNTCPILRKSKSSKLSSQLSIPKSNPTGKALAFSGCRVLTFGNSRRVLGVVKGVIFPVDPWAPNIDSQSIASLLFAVSLFPYIGFLYFITKSKTAPNPTMFGFYFLLAFVGATIPAGIYAKVQYGTSLSNVDWLHGGFVSDG